MALPCSVLTGVEIQGQAGWRLWPVLFLGLFARRARLPIVWQI